jgi:hypothetical protein
MFKSREGLESIHAFRAAQQDLSTAGDHLLLLARCGNSEGEGPERLVTVKDPDSWPEDRLTSYVILLDGARRIRLLQVIPNSESGDWYEQDDHLFRPDGSIRYWEHYRGSFVPEEPMKAWLASAWSPDGQALDRVSRALGPEGKPWKGAKPTSPQSPPTHLGGLLVQHKLVEALSAAKVVLR